MDLKYTIEIITKDIQEIEKLVGKLKNSGDASMIEIDLALTKLQRVYEVLGMIRQDQLKERIETLSEGTVPEPEPQPEPEPKPEPEPEPQPEPEPKAEPKAATKAKPETGESAILAERFSSEASLNEEMPIDNIARNIGINDRFLIIRELFDGDADAFADLLSRLDEAGSLQAANSLMDKYFGEVSEHHGLEILEGLLKRRYSKQNG